MLVGHSIGGPDALTYTDQYPDEIAGMVLLDSSSPEQFTAIPSHPSQYAARRTDGARRRASSQPS